MQADDRRRAPADRVLVGPEERAGIRGCSADRPAVPHRLDQFHPIEPVLVVDSAVELQLQLHDADRPVGGELVGQAGGRIGDDGDARRGHGAGG